MTYPSIFLIFSRAFWILSWEAAKLNLTKSIDVAPNAVPGTAFGKTSIDYVRFSFAASQDNIQKALEKIKEMLG